jgi:hypothetical protein
LVEPAFVIATESEAIQRDEEPERWRWIAVSLGCAPRDDDSIQAHLALV